MNPNILIFLRQLQKDRILNKILGVRKKYVSFLFLNRCETNKFMTHSTLVKYHLLTTFSFSFTKFKRTILF